MLRGIGKLVATVRMLTRPRSYARPSRERNALLEERENSVLEERNALLEERERIRSSKERNALLEEREFTDVGVRWQKETAESHSLQNSVSGYRRRSLPIS